MQKLMLGTDQDLETIKLRKINKALMERVERSMDQQGNAYSLFQTAIGLEDQVRRRTAELTKTLADLERSNLQLVKAKEAAEEANLSKTRFLAAASHDVLQPLNAALLLMSTLSTTQTDTNKEGLRLCRQVEHSLETMDALLRNLLFISRLDAGDVRPHWQTVSLDAMFASIALDFEPIAKVRNLELRVRATGLHVWSDPTMLRRTIQNIVANALRYTKNGGALLTAGRRGDSVHIRIADTGIGIEPKRFKEIFIEFQRCSQGNDDLDGSSAGLGLGLAIVERMVNSLKMTLTLNSRVGHGSCFGLKLQYKPSPPKPAFPPSSLRTDKINGARLADTRILVIENDLAALQAMEALLTQWGCNLRLASSTQETMDALNNDTAWVPDLIVADQHLNNNEWGTSVIRIVRQLLGKRIPAVVVTADPSDRLWKMADQGRLEVMQKPVKPAQLRALLSHMRSRAGGASAI